MPPARVTAYATYRHASDLAIPAASVTASQVSSWSSCSEMTRSSRGYPTSLSDTGGGGRSPTGIPYRDDARRVADFHCLRHSFISNLAAGGVHPKTGQTLARHSTISLTMNTYTHGYAGDEAAALAVLPDLSIPAAGVLEANGTDHATPRSITPDGSPDSRSAQPGVPGANGRTEAGRNSQPAAVAGGGQNHLAGAALRHDTQADATVERRGRDSNPRYRGKPVCRFSKPVHSATLPPLQVAHS